EEVLDAEVEDLPEAAAVALADVEVAEHEREPDEGAGRGRGKDDAGAPVIDEPPVAPAQDLAADEARALEEVGERLAAEERVDPLALERARPGRDVRPLVRQRVQGVVVDQVRERDRVLPASDDHLAVAVAAAPPERHVDAEVANDVAAAGLKVRGEP